MYINDSESENSNKNNKSPRKFGTTVKTFKVSSKEVEYKITLRMVLIEQN
jgi:hypothetical protein